MRIPAKWTIVAAAGLLLAACGAVPEPGGDDGDTGEAAWSPRTAELLYSGRRGGQIDLYLQAGLDGEPRRLTEGGNNNGGRWSPDGSTILFQSQRDGNYEIYSMNADGSEPRNLTRNPAFDGLPLWSPDGATVAFFSQRDLPYSGEGPFRGHIYTMRPDGGEVTRRTLEPLESTYGPTGFSPDGGGVLLAREVGEQTDLFLIDLATGEETRLTSSPASESSASYSPDGTRLAFTEAVDDRASLVVLDPATGERRLVSPETGRHYYPRWSPDGRWITATVLGRLRQYDVRAFAVDEPEVGSDTIALVLTPQDERESSWRPIR